MNPDRWSRVKDAFVAVTQGVEIDVACEGDTTIRREVESLLASATCGEGFLETPALDLWLARQLMPDRCGPWRIVREIGQGGMATVYLADRDDGQYRKTAALKVMREGVFGPEARARFLRERQLLADLDHPGIVRLIDGGVLPDGRPYLVEDYIDGEDLVSFGANLNVPERLALFARVCEAVQYAHDRGVIHRDIKPANILVNGAGEPKLLDFGIARWLEQESGETRAHYWTPRYAAPEQARGEPAGAGSDIYSLGVVLRELLGGAVPPGASRVIAKCLAARPSDRWTSAVELERAVRRLPERTWHRWCIAAVLALVSAWFASTFYAPGSPPKATLEFSGGIEPSLSPGGDFVAFAKQEVGFRELTVRRLATGETRTLGRAITQSWSPDGRSIAVMRELDNSVIGLFLVAPGDGSARELARMPAYGLIDFEAGVRIAWSADSTKVVCSYRESEREPYALWSFDTATGAKARLTHPPADIAGDTDGAASSDRRWLVFSRQFTHDAHDLVLVDLASGRERRLTNDQRPIAGTAWTLDGSGVLWAARRPGSRHRALWRLSIAEAEPVPRLAYSVDGDVSYPSVSAGGLAVQIQVEDVNLWAGGKAISPPGVSAMEGMPVWSPDGARIAFMSDASGDTEIWSCGADGHDRKQLTTMRGPYTDAPRWSPDGAWIVFTSATGGNRDIFRVASTGGAAQRLTDAPTQEGRASYSRDGRWIYFRSGSNIFRMPSGGGAWQQITRGGGYEPLESIDGRTLYYPRDRSQPGLWAVPVHGGEERLLTAGPVAGAWAPVRDGIEFFDINRNSDRHAIKRFVFATGLIEQRQTVALAAGGFFGFDASPDGSRWAFGHLDDARGWIAWIPDRAKIQ